MDVRRSINTKMWSDPWVEGLKPEEKLVWVYLLTNRDANLLGIYEISIGRIAYETGLSQDKTRTIMESFERVSKAYYWFGRVFLPNWMKNQAMNPNMVKSASEIFTNLPNEFKVKLKEFGVECFESLSKGLVTIPQLKGKLKGEIEKEGEIPFDGVDDEKQKIEKIYAAYPTKCPVKKRSLGKSGKNKTTIATRLKTYSEEDLLLIIERYLNDCSIHNTPLKNFDTFLNQLPIDYLKYDPKEEQSWITNIEEYKSFVRNEFNIIHKDQEFRKQFALYFPNADIDKTLRKQYDGYWATEVGWIRIKESGVSKPDFRALLFSTPKNQIVYEQ